MSLQRFGIALSTIFWLFALLLGYAEGRITREFDWRTFWIVIGASGLSYVLSAGIWRALRGAGTPQRLKSPEESLRGGRLGVADLPPDTRRVSASVRTQHCEQGDLERSSRATRPRARS
jgi:hypothetical protein